MGWVELKFDVAGEQQLDAMIEKVRFLPSDLSPAFKRIADDFYQSLQSRFKAEGSFAGAPRWTALSWRYARWKLGLEGTASRREVKIGRQFLGETMTRHGGEFQITRKLGKRITRIGRKTFIGGVAPGAKILQLRAAPTYRGKLAKSPNLMESLRPGGPENVTAIEPQALTMGSTLKVGGWNLGLLHQRGTKRMPARQIIVLSSTQRLRWKNLLREFLVEQLAIIRRERPTTS